jgi:predicted regulator of Ras-like GTPase activity (Roadblock/LC7/MglB family)
MTAAEAIEELNEISSQISAAVLFAADGDVLASTLPPERAAALAAAARALLESARDGGDVTQLDAAVAGGSVFVVTDEARAIAATTGPEPTVGLVFYDLKSCLRTVTAGELEEQQRAAAARPKRPRKKKVADESA